MNLEFLDIEPNAQFASNYLRHMNEIINVKLEKGNTYHDLFKECRELFPKDEARQKAVNDWIKMNITEQDEDPSVFETIIAEEGEVYAVFNLQP